MYENSMSSYEITLFEGNSAAETRNGQRARFDPQLITETMWAPGLFQNNTRSNANLRSISLLVLDVDEHCDLPHALKLFAPYKHVIGTSKSHGIEKKGKVADRFRVVLFLEQPATSDSEFKEYWFAAFAKWPFIDQACKDSARFFFPCKEIVSVNEDGVLFGERVGAAQVTISPPIRAVKGTKGKLSKATKDFLIDGAPDGEWHGRFFKAAMDFKEKGFSIEEAEVKFTAITGHLDDHDIQTLTDVFENRMPKYPVQEGTLAAQALRDLIISSKFIINISDPEETVLFSHNTGAVHDVKLSVIAQLLGRSEFALYQTTNFVYAKFIYDRFLPAPLVTDSNSGVQIYNTYVPPTWKVANFYFSKPLTKVESLPEIYDLFFTHLTDGHTASKEYILDWLANALTSRNYTVLTAIGEEGVGKGVLGEIMERLFGESNFTAVRDDIFKNKFNGQLRNKALVYIDEVRLRDEEDHNRLKAVVNNKIEVERKGKDAELLNNQASFYLSSNHQDAIRLSGTDRRFSIIQMTSQKLIETPLIARITELLSPANIEALAVFLLGRTLTHTMTVPFASQRKDDVMEAGLFDWEYFVIFEWAAENIGKTISLNDLKTKIQDHLGNYRRAPGRNKVLELAKKYPQYLRIKQVHGSGERLVTVVQAPTEPIPKLRSPSLIGNS